MVIFDKAARFWVLGSSSRADGPGAEAEEPAEKSADIDAETDAGADADAEAELFGSCFEFGFLVAKESAGSGTEPLDASADTGTGAGADADAGAGAGAGADADAARFGFCSESGFFMSLVVFEISSRTSTGESAVRHE